VLEKQTCTCTDSRITFFLDYFDLYYIMDVFNIRSTILDLVSELSTASFFVHQPALDELKAFKKLISQNWILKKSFNGNSCIIQILVYVRLIVEKTLCCSWNCPFVYNLSFVLWGLVTFLSGFIIMKEWLLQCGLYNVLQERQCVSLLERKNVQIQNYIFLE